MKQRPAMLCILMTAIAVLLAIFAACSADRGKPACNSTTQESVEGDFVYTKQNESCDDGTCHLCCIACHRPSGYCEQDCTECETECAMPVVSAPAQAVWTEGESCSAGLWGHCAEGLVCQPGSAEETDGYVCLPPMVLTLSGIWPPAGAEVENASIRHTFTIKESPGMFDRIELSTEPGHTAGDSSPMPWQFRVTDHGGDLLFEGNPVTWATVPGHVEMTIRTQFQTDEGRIYVFPSPLFSYDIVAALGP